MLISCPFCGPRDSVEFTYLGDATPKRPAFSPEELDGLPPQKAFYDYVYLRDNLAGEIQEYWYHGGGCRSWLLAARDTVSHEFKSVRASPGIGAKQVTRAGDA
ncbi:sarcosine oxidase subunit delta [Mesorhizobium sp. Cs1321R2N1]|uniref:sarcosine oxidase subunit delta n=1 Tax=Mesorhizobium sp. Cs1321R2N1 TaxID=3015174 RepID=UPI00301CFA2D